MARVLKYQCDKCETKLEAPAFVPEGYTPAEDPNIQCWYQIGSRLILDTAGKTPPRGLELLEACSLKCVESLSSAVRQRGLKAFGEALEPRKALGLDMTVRTILIMVAAPAPAVADAH
jgi:hypothetical protein